MCQRRVLAAAKALMRCLHSHVMEWNDMMVWRVLTFLDIMSTIMITVFSK